MNESKNIVTQGQVLEWIGESLNKGKHESSGSEKSLQELKLSRSNTLLLSSE